jgi:type II secretory pathway component PulJ
MTHFLPFPMGGPWRVGVNVRGERGIALLEVLLALMILSTVGVALVVLVADALEGMRWAGEREGRYAEANAVLTRLALRDRQGLDLRLGRRAEGAFVTDVQRPRPMLYRLAVLDSSPPNEQLLVTVVRRAEGP